MTALKPGDDPYRILGVLRSADLDQIKAAHRRLAKRFHPDRATGDEARFLAVQEAYQLLTDPLRRRDWDRRHAPGPVRATQTGPTSRRRPAPAATRRPRDGRPRPASGRAARPMPPPGRRTTTWSAEHIPWWEDFRPRDQAGGDGAPRGESGERPKADAEPSDMDVFNRSSGAAWSMAARRHFRRGDSDLPSRGAWRYRGTQVVTGAEARKVAAEEAARRSPRRPGSKPDDGPA